MIKELNLLHSDLVLNSGRLLILLSKFHRAKSYKMNLDKIMILDFYMKFPTKMINQDKLDSEAYDFNDVYSYFHWKPDRDQYNLFLNYLISKRLITLEIVKKDFIYFISEDGLEMISNFQSIYYKKLNSTADYIKKNISNQSDEKLEAQIFEKSLNIIDKEITHDK